MGGRIPLNIQQISSIFFHYELEPGFNAHTHQTSVKEDWKVIENKSVLSNVGRLRDIDPWVCYCLTTTKWVTYEPFVKRNCVGPASSRSLAHLVLERHTCKSIYSINQNAFSSISHSLHEILYNDSSDDFKPAYSKSTFYQIYNSIINAF